MPNRRLDAPEVFRVAAERESYFREAIEKNRQNIERMAQERKEQKDGPDQDTRSE